MSTRDRSFIADPVEFLTEPGNGHGRKGLHAHVKLYVCTIAYLEFSVSLPGLRSFWKLIGGSFSADLDCAYVSTALLGPTEHFS